MQRPTRPPPPLTRREIREFAFFMLAFGVLFGAGWLLSAQGAPALEAALAVALIAAFIAAILSWRAAWHALANRFFVAPPRRLSQPRVIDGDTIEDRATGVRYRLANIDAPETGDRAKCLRERMRGDEATRAAIDLARAAGEVSVRATCRTDRYGRRVAFVMLDGRDLGEELIGLGLARPWRGRRVRWCGPRGGLARMARTGGYAFSCATCRRW